MSYHLGMTTLDPILPLPVGTGLPEVRQGEGKRILTDTRLVDCGMTFRAFYSAWEQVERRAAENYRRYIDNPQLQHVADAWLEAVLWFRQQAHPGMDVKQISESKARKIRAEEAAKAKKPKARSKTTTPVKESKDVPEAASSPACPECGETEVLKVEKKGKPFWKCFECEHKWPREAPGGPSKAPKGKGNSQGKSKKKSKKEKKAGKKKARDLIPADS